MARFLTPEPVRSARKQLYAVQVTYILRQGRDTQTLECRGVVVAVDEVEAVADVQYANRYHSAKMYCAEKLAMLISEQKVREQFVRDLEHNLSNA